MNRLKAKFMIDYHSYGELILYPEGWQVETQRDRRPAHGGARRPRREQPGDPGL